MRLLEDRNALFDAIGTRALSLWCGVSLSQHGYRFNRPIQSGLIARFRYRTSMTVPMCRLTSTTVPVAPFS